MTDNLHQEIAAINDMIGSSNYAIAEIGKKLTESIPAIKAIGEIVNELKDNITLLEKRVSQIEHYLNEKFIEEEGD